MSYVRFSSDQWRSDVYAYEAKDGISIHVAARRHVLHPDHPMPNPLSFEDWVDDTDKCFEHRNAEQVALDNATLVAIGGPFDGRDYYGLTHSEAVDALEEIAQNGYHVPVGVIEVIGEEARDIETQETR